MDPPRLDSFSVTDQGSGNWQITMPSAMAPADQCGYEVLADDVLASSGMLAFEDSQGDFAGVGVVIKGRVRYMDSEGNPLSDWSLFNVVVLA